MKQEGNGAAPKKFGRRYPWADWFVSLKRSKRVEMVPGADFVCRPYAFAQMVRNEASRREISVSVSVADDGRVEVTPGRGPHAKYHKVLVAPKEWR